MTRSWYLVLFVLAACGTPAERAAEKALHEGAGPYRSADYSSAASIFAAAAFDGRVASNLGSALYRAGQLDTAISSFTAAAARSSDTTVQAKAGYDLGNAWFMLSRQADSTANTAGEMLGNMTIQGDDIREKVRQFIVRDSIVQELVRLEDLVDSALHQSADAYKNCLRRTPADEDARHNLSLVERSIAARKKEAEERARQRDQDKNKELSERAKLLMEQADALVDEYKFNEALKLLRDGMKAEPSLGQRQDYMNKLDVVTKAAEAK